MKKIVHLTGGFLTLAIATLCGSNAVAATAIPSTFFGLNYTYYSGTTGTSSTGDEFNVLKNDLSSMKLGMVRVGGNEADQASHGAQWFADAAKNIRALGAEPVIQLPRDLSTANVSSWIDTLNNAPNSLNITYFAIGNEPDPGGTDVWKTWYPVCTVNCTTKTPLNDYPTFKANFIALAKKVKDKIPNAKIIGPDFRLFFGSATDANTPFGSFYKDFIDDVGRQEYTPAGTSTPKELLDILAVHFYAYGWKSEADTMARWAEFRTLVDSANNTTYRPYGNLQTALGEVNTMPSQAPAPWDFEAAQFQTIMAKHTLLNLGAYYAPWGVRENCAKNRQYGSSANGYTDFGIYDHVNTGTCSINDASYSTVRRRPAAWHLSMLSENRHNYWMNSTRLNDNTDVSSFSMYDNSGFTIMLMNTSETDINVGVTLLAGTYNGSTGLQISFDGAKSTASSNFSTTLAKKSTTMYTFDANGNRLLKYQIKKYSSGTTVDPYPVPVVTTITEAFNQTTANQIVNRGTQYMRPNGGNVQNAFIIQQYSAAKPGSTLTSYQWNLLPSTISGYNGWYRLKNVATGQIVKVLNGSTAAGATLQEVDNTTDNQVLLSAQWRPELNAADGTYWFKNANSGMYIRPSAGSTADGTGLVQDVLNSTYSSFEWTIAP